MSKRKGNRIGVTLPMVGSVSGKTVPELKRPPHELHPVKWKTANAKPPDTQCEYWQFQLNKSKGRVIGILIDGVFYIILGNGRFVSMKEKDILL